MRALVSEVRGGPATLVVRDVPTPQPGPGEVRVRVAACGVNYLDSLIIEDRYQSTPERPFSPGAEVSGIVDALGDDVTGLSVGDRMMAGVLWGGMAEQVVVPAWRCFPITDEMPFDQAAGFLMTYGTSHYALKDRARLQAGERLLVVGAAGGVGLAAVELGKLMGARVIATVSTEEKADIARRHGADEAIVHPAGPLDKAQARAFSEAIRVAAGGAVDVVYDAVGGSYSEPAMRTLGWDGRFLVVGFPAGIASIPLNLPLLKSCNIYGVFWGAWIERDPDGFRDNVQQLLDWYREGGLTPLVSDRFPLAQGGEAITRLSSRRAIGKIIVSIE